MGAPVEHQIRIGGRTLNLVFGLRAIMALQERWGLEQDREVWDRFNGVIADQKAGKNPPIKIAADMFYAATRTHHRAELDWDACLDLMDGEGLKSISPILRACMDSMMSSLKGIEADDDPPGKAAAA